MLKRTSYLLLGILVLLVACKKNENLAVNPQLDYAYFGLEQGRFVEYEVNYMEHDSLLNKHDTTRFYYKTVIGDEYMDNEGRKGYEFMRYRKDSLMDNYQFLSKWVIQIADYQAQLVEENQRLIKMVFPILKTQEWDVNVYNNDEATLAHYKDIHSPYANMYFSTDSSTTVETKNYQTLIDDQLEQETYAKNVGMISKVSKELYFQFGQTKPFKGTELYMEIMTTGIE